MCDTFWIINEAEKCVVITRFLFRFFLENSPWMRGYFLYYLNVIWFSHVFSKRANKSFVLGRAILKKDRHSFSCDQS